MNRIALRTVAASFAVATAALAAPFAMAQEATPDYPTVSTSTVTRADVAADMAKARADGSIRAWSTSYNPLAIAKSERSRDAVRAEAVAAGATTAAMTGEDSGSFALSHQPALRAPSTFAQVR